MADPKPLRRDQIRLFVQDPEVVLRIERLFEQAGDNTITNLEQVQINAQSAVSVSNQAVGMASHLMDREQQIINITANYSPLPKNMSVIADATGGALTVTLPLAIISKGRIIGVTKTDTSSNAVTVQRSGTDLIVGETSHDLLFDGEVLNFISDGSAWQLAN